jgi:hypothetical protein
MFEYMTAQEAAELWDIGAACATVMQRKPY